jgi:hypothetical protein
MKNVSPACVFVLALVAAACSTTPTERVVAELPGRWFATIAAESGEEIDLSVADTVVTGTGEWNEGQLVSLNELDVTCSTPGSAPDNEAFLRVTP